MKFCVLLRRLRNSPAGESASAILGRCGEAALSTALALHAQVPGSEVIVIAAGDSEHQDELLARALSVGAHRAVRVHDDALANVDYHAVAQVLAAVLKQTTFDLVLTGDRSEDEGQGAVGPAVAEWLDVPHVTGVSSVTTAQGNDGSVTITRRDGGLVRTLRVPTPAVLGVRSFGGKQVSLDDVQIDPAASSQVNIETVDLEGLGIHSAEIRHRDQCLGSASPVQPTRATIVATADELVSKLHEHHLLVEH